MAQAVILAFTFSDEIVSCYKEPAELVLFHDVQMRGIFGRILSSIVLVPRDPCGHQGCDDCSDTKDCFVHIGSKPRAKLREWAQAEGVS